MLRVARSVYLSLRTPGASTQPPQLRAGHAQTQHARAPGQLRALKLSNLPDLSGDAGAAAVALAGGASGLPSPHGPLRRWLALVFCEKAGREMEYLALTQDTTESDLKQRREIVNGTATFTDQAPVRAALCGRVLILDGIEKAERNVLPTLNNLLENREI